VITAVSEVSQVAEARRLVSGYARSIGFAEVRVAEIAIVVTELATNLLKHAGSGHILATYRDDDEGAGLELLALDRGSGMTDVGRCMDDGYSTAGSPGNGLGAITRLADDLRIYSRSGLGSAIMVRFQQQAARASLRTLLGAAVTPYPGEQISGDNWAFHETSHGRTLLVADGSGHGVEAARAADLAVRSFLDNAEGSCEEIVDRMHRALMPTRGAAVAVARVDEVARTVRYVGVGNICGAVITGEGIRRMVSHNGTAGHVAPRIREFTYDFTSTPLVIMHSDGLTGRWDLASYPGLPSQHPSLIAGVLLRDHRRARDDASVVAMRPVCKGLA
jgi:anti-sigma regulatory factor (Ser/Thr protein kinase)